MSSQISCGIVGLPNVGKSTLFNALTDNQALVANYPFATINPNTGVVPIPDIRLEKLAELYKTDKIVPATITFVDIAGIVAGASRGEGLGNQFLSHIRTSNAIIEVVRAFNDPNVTHVEERVDPSHDIDIIATELILADLQTVEKRLSHFAKLAKADPKLKTQLDFLEKIKSLLDANQSVYGSIRAEDLEKNEQELLNELQLLSAKPIIYVFNVSEEGLSNTTEQNELSKLVLPSSSIFICAKLEDELRGLDKADAAELLLSYGQSQSGLVQLIHAAYDLLGLQSFLTAGPKEVRAWTIPKGSNAPAAAGVIHSDFERGFIAAEVVSYSDLIDSGSITAARSAGKVRTEGKDYIVKDDDVIEFRFNV